MVVIGPRSSCSAIGRTVVGRGWIDTGGIRRREVEGEAAAEAAAEVVAAAIWGIGCGRSAKGRRRDRPFLFSYI
jgi:hypothetical protein